MRAAGMVFCRCCGKQIHESAPTCPQCGGPQYPEKSNTAPAQKIGLWLPVTALGFAVLGVLATLDEAMPNRDTTTGIITFALIGIVFGSVSFRNQAAGKKMAIAGVVLAAVSLVLLAGRFAD